MRPSQEPLLPDSSDEANGRQMCHWLETVGIRRTSHRSQEDFPPQPAEPAEPLPVEPAEPAEAWSFQISDVFGCTIASRLEAIAIRLEVGGHRY